MIRRRYEVVVRTPGGDPLSRRRYWTVLRASRAMGRLAALPPGWSVVMLQDGKQVATIMRHS